jgi:hypothetical protein
MSNKEGYDAAYEYTVRFYPRYFTWVQFHINSDNSQRQGAGENIANRLTGPLGMGRGTRSSWPSTTIRSTPRPSST